MNPEQARFPLDAKHLIPEETFLYGGSTNVAVLEISGSPLDEDGTPNFMPGIHDIRWLGLGGYEFGISYGDLNTVAQSITGIMPMLGNAGLIAAQNSIRLCFGFLQEFEKEWAIFLHNGFSVYNLSIIEVYDDEQQAEDEYHKVLGTLSKGDLSSLSLKDAGPVFGTVEDGIEILVAHQPFPWMEGQASPN